MPFADINGIRYHYERSGSGDTVVLITGLAGDTTFWSRAVPLLSDTFDVIAVDNRGSGQTESEGEFTMEDMADDVAALLDHLGVSKAHILGWSMGSHIALCLAVRRPELVRTLTLVSSYLKRPSRSAYMLRHLAEGYYAGTIDAETVGVMMNVMLRTEGFFRSAEEKGRPIRNPNLDRMDGMYLQMRSVEGFDIGNSAASVKVPTLSVHGLEDVMTPPSCGDEIAAEIGGCRILRVPGEGHIMRPKTYIPAFIEFAKEHRGPEENPPHPL